MKSKILFFGVLIILFGGCAKKAVSVDPDYQGKWVDGSCATFEIDAKSYGHLYTSASSQYYCYENVDVSGTVKLKGVQMTIGSKTYRVLQKPVSIFEQDITLPDGSMAKTDMSMYVGNWSFYRIKQ